MGAIDLWADGQRTMSALGRTLDAADGERPVPACPAWTVREVFAHQAGVAADLLALRLEGITTEPWTARQVDERAERSLDEILDEWDADAPRLVEMLRPMEDDVDPRLVLDVWTHGQDVRHAVGRPGERSGPVVDFVVEQVRDFVEEQFTDAGLDPIRIDCGDGRTVAAVRVDPYEFVRAVVGRRSADQVAEWAWSVPDPSPYVEVMPAFALRPDALEEPA